MCFLPHSFFAKNNFLGEKQHVMLKVQAFFDTDFRKAPSFKRILFEFTFSRSSPSLKQKHPQLTLHLQRKGLHWI